MSTDTSVRYIDKSRDYYAAHGYEVPYHWAQYDSVPFSKLTRPLSECTVTVVTTAMPDASYTGNDRRLVKGDLHNPPDTFYTGELAWDQQATHTDDRESYFPAFALARLVREKTIGGLAKNFYCVPTAYSHRATVERDAPEIVASCLADGVDIALLVPL